MKVKDNRMCMILCILICLSVCFAFVGCGGSDTDIAETTETTQATEPTEETTTTEPTTTKPTTTMETTKADKYADSAKYLSDFKTIEGNGYNVTVSDELDGDYDFTELKNCALYTMRKAYAKYETDDMGVFGYHENGIDPAFMYDGAYGDQTIYVYGSDLTSPKGWQWALSPDDWDYIKGGE